MAKKVTLCLCDKTVNKLESIKLRNETTMSNVCANAIELLAWSVLQIEEGFTIQATKDVGNTTITREVTIL